MKQIWRCAISSGDSDFIECLPCARHCAICFIMFSQARSNFFKNRRYFYCGLCVILSDDTHFKDLYAWRWHTSVGEKLEVWCLRGNYKQELNQVSLSLSMSQRNSWGWTETNWKCAPDPQQQCSLWRLPERNASLVWKTFWLFKRIRKFRFFKNGQSSHFGKLAAKNKIYLF